MEIINMLLIKMLFDNRSFVVDACLKNAYDISSIQVSVCHFANSKYLIALFTASIFVADFLIQNVEYKCNIFS